MLIRDKETYAIVLKLNLAAVSPLVLPVGVQGQQSNENDGQETAGNAGVDTGAVVRSVLESENQAACDTTDTTETDQGRTAEGALPLATDVVGLVGHGGRDVRVGTSGDQEDGEVADARRTGEAHDGKTDQTQNHVEDDDRPADLVLVASPASRKHDEGTKDVRRSDQALRRSNSETHVLVQDDGEEVSQRVCDGGAVEEDLMTVSFRNSWTHLTTYESIAPDLGVETGTEEFGRGERFVLGITTIMVDTVDDELSLTLGDELPGLMGLVGEVNQRPVTNDTEEARQSTLDDEDPAPSGEALESVHLH